MNREKAIEWIGTHDVGISSRTMWCGLMGLKPENIHSYQFDVPHDSDDFSRCFDLVEFSEATEEDLMKVVVVFPYYKPIIDIWGKLVNAYIGKDYKRVYDLLNGCHDEIMELKGFNKVKDGYWIKK